MSRVLSCKALDAASTASLLAHYGIPVLPSAGFETEDDAVAAADRLGWPVALKTTDPALRHRLDLGGVRLDIEDAESLRRTIVQMRRALAPYGSRSLEVQSMAPVGQACTFRAIEDPLLGPVISFGLAGDAVNLLDDWAHRVPPAFRRRRQGLRPRARGPPGSCWVTRACRPWIWMLLRTLPPGWPG